MTEDKPMGRRQFFSLGLGGVARAGAEVLEDKVKRTARHFIRPPFAVDELDFLLNCSRCGDCIEACPHDVIFALTASRGMEVAGTPALDLLNRGCHLCTDWPCVAACPEKVLILPTVESDIESDEVSGIAANGVPAVRPGPSPADCPPLAQLQIDTDVCLPYVGPECGACYGSCPVPDTLVWQDEKPRIVAQTCVGCALCREACITEPKAISVHAL